MQNRPSENLKSVAAELAALIYAGSTDTVKMNGLLAQLKQPVAQAEPVAKEKAAPSDHIGIWQPSKEKNTYERDISQHFEWPLWASTHKIEAKGSRKRILLLGESVARGYFYDPLYTVANELEAILTHTKGLEETEVIDLAKTSMTMEGLLELSQASIRLEPDAVVVFAGNNWDSSLAKTLDSTTDEKIFDQYRSGLFEGVKKFLEERYAKIVADFLTEMAAPFREKGIPVLFIIPPFNLRDWHSDEAERILPWMPDNRMERWLDARSRAEGALANCDNEKLLSFAGTMVSLDPSNPLGFELLGEAHARLGNHAEAINAFEQARDTAIVSRGNNSKPRCFGIIVRTIENTAPAVGMQVLNLPQIFNHLDDVPGRDLFLDYCHLTVRGIKIAMTHAAQSLAQIFGCADAVCRPSDTELTNETLAMAHFCAAIHNAHWGQSPEMLDYHCSKAVDYSPSVQNVMLQFMNFSTRHTSSILCKTFEEILVNGSMRQYEGGRALRHPRGKKMLDIALNDAIVHALGSIGLDVRRELSKLRRSEHAITTDGTSLLEFYYSRTSYNDFVVQPRPNYLQARNTTTEFSFIVGDYKNLHFSITYRTPRRAYEDKKIGIFINGAEAPVSEMPMSREWMVHRFTLTEAQLKEGVNNLYINWPYTQEPLASTKLVTGNSFMNEIFPVLGEVHAFDVSGSREAVPAATAQQAAFSRLSV